MRFGGSILNIQKSLYLLRSLPWKSGLKLVQPKMAEMRSPEKLLLRRSYSSMVKPGRPFPDQGRCRETLKFAGGGWSR